MIAPHIRSMQTTECSASAAGLPDDRWSHALRLARPGVCNSLWWLASFYQGTLQTVGGRWPGGR